MKSVFILQHLHILPDDTEDVKIIGIYSSEANAKEALERLKNQPGFCDSPELKNPHEDEVTTSGFYIDEYKLDSDHWVEGYVTMNA